MSLKKFVSDENVHLCSIGELQDALQNTKVIPYSFLTNMQSLNELFGEGDSAILLIQSPSGNHFITLLRRKSYIEYFDPYGDPIDYMIKKSDMEPYLTRLLQNVRVVSNKVKLQKMSKDINNCGRWAFTRVKLRELSLRKFQQLFTTKMIVNPDNVVCLMTSLIF